MKKKQISEKKKQCQAQLTFKTHDPSYQTGNNTTFGKKHEA